MYYSESNILKAFSSLLAFPILCLVLNLNHFAEHA